MNLRIPGVLACCAMLAACAQQPTQDDPLQNTKKLAIKGHTTLYNNGLFEVPMTTIHLIPAGPDAWSLAAELGGVLPRQSVKDSMKHAHESLELMNAGVRMSGDTAQQINDSAAETAHTINKGSDKSARDVKAAADAAAQGIKEGTDAAAEAMQPVTRLGVEVAKEAPGAGLGIAAASVTYGGETYGAVADAARTVSAESAQAAGALSAASSDAASGLWEGTQSVAGRMAARSRAASGASMSQAKSYILGIAVVPDQLAQHYRDATQHVSLSAFGESARATNDWRKEAAGKMSAVMVQTGKNYAVEASAPFKAADKSWEQAARDNGYNLAMLKYLGWTLQGIFWDATVKPVGEMAGASLGYIVVNGAAIPVLVAREAGNVMKVAVQVTWNSAAGAYDVTAPGAAAALSGMLGAAQLLGGHALAAGECAAGGAAAAGTYALGKTAAGATWAGGKLAGGALYVGAPLSSVGVAAGGATLGVVTAAGGVAGGAGIAATGVAGEGLARAGGAAGAATARAYGTTAAAAERVGGRATAGAVRAGGTAAAGAVLVGGSAASVATGVALGGYELSKAVVAPVTYGIGSGLVLSYGTASQLAAQGVYLAGDATYLILSQEGPRWVLYAVTGRLHNGEKLPSGAVVDLGRMRDDGEKIVAVPVSDEQMQRVIGAVPAQLPAMPKRPDTQPTQATVSAQAH